MVYNNWMNPTEPKPIYTSKTALGAVATIVAANALPAMGIDASAESVGTIAGVLMFVLRFITTGAVKFW
jgi:hypothetical protein